MGFDPLVPDNWENITRRQVLAHKVRDFLFILRLLINHCINLHLSTQGGASLLKGKKGYRGVLQSAFPELKLKSKHMHPSSH